MVNTVLDRKNGHIFVDDRSDKVSGARSSQRFRRVEMPCDKSESQLDYMVYMYSTHRTALEQQSFLEEPSTHGGPIRISISTSTLFHRSQHKRQSRRDIRFHLYLFQRLRHAQMHAREKEAKITSIASSQQVLAATNKAIQTTPATDTHH
jgi:hypothetical protein